MTLRSSDEIYAHALWTIQSLHSRPAVFIGPGDRVGDADALDALFWLAYRFWSSILQRDTDFGEAIATEERDRKYTKIGFPHSYRESHPDCSPNDVVLHVLECWANIGTSLGVDVNAKPDDSLISTRYNRG